MAPLTCGGKPCRPWSCSVLLEVHGCIPETAEVGVLKILGRVRGQDFKGEVFLYSGGERCSSPPNRPR